MGGRTWWFSAWFDVIGLRAGANWRQTIEREIVRSRAVILILSPEFFESTECMAELEIARRHGKRLIPLMLRPAPLPPPLADLHVARIRESHVEDSLRAIKSALTADEGWEDEYRYVLEQAIRWDDKGRSDGALRLIGRELREMDALLKSPPDDRRPAPIVGEYLRACGGLNDWESERDKHYFESLSERIGRGELSIQETEAKFKEMPSNRRLSAAEIVLADAIFHAGGRVPDWLPYFVSEFPRRVGLAHGERSELLAFALGHQWLPHGLVQALMADGKISKRRLLEACQILKAGSEPTAEFTQPHHIARGAVSTWGHDHLQATRELLLWLFETARRGVRPAIEASLSDPTSELALLEALIDHERTGFPFNQLIGCEPTPESAPWLLSWIEDLVMRASYGYLDLTNRERMHLVGASAMAFARAGHWGSAWGALLMIVQNPFPETAADPGRPDPRICITERDRRAYGRRKARQIVGLADAADAPPLWRAAIKLLFGIARHESDTLKRQLLDSVSEMEQEPEETLEGRLALERIQPGAMLPSPWSISL